MYEEILVNICVYFILIKTIIYSLKYYQDVYRCLSESCGYGTTSQKQVRTVRFKF